MPVFQRSNGLVSLRQTDHIPRNQHIRDPYPINAGNNMTGMNLPS